MKASININFNLQCGSLCEVEHVKLKFTSFPVHTTVQNDFNN